jgi:hypothetical protein
MIFILSLISSFNLVLCFLQGYTKKLLSNFERNFSIQIPNKTLILIFFYLKREVPNDSKTAHTAA